MANLKNQIEIGDSSTFFINERLKKVASFIEEESRIIDVGCDHAFLDIYVVTNIPGTYAIASDNKIGPLESARKNVKKYHVEDQVQIKLGNGIEPIDETIDTIVISGMGGWNMIGILKYQPYLYKNVQTIILSPNSDANHVRKEIVKLGFKIENEALIKEKNLIYPVLVFKRGKKHYSKKEYLFGPILLERKDSLLMEYLNFQRLQKEKLLKILPKNYIKRRWELKKELKLIQKCLSLFL